MSLAGKGPIFAPIPKKRGPKGHFSGLRNPGKVPTFPPGNSGGPVFGPFNRGLGKNPEIGVHTSAPGGFQKNSKNDEKVTFSAVFRTENLPYRPLFNSVARSYPPPRWGM